MESVLRSGEACHCVIAVLTVLATAILVILANKERDRAEVLREGHQAQVVLADEENRPQKVFAQTLIPRQDAVEFQCEHDADDNKGDILTDYESKAILMV